MSKSRMLQLTAKGSASGARRLRGLATKQDAEDPRVRPARSAEPGDEQGRRQAVVAKLPLEQVAIELRVPSSYEVSKPRRRSAVQWPVRAMYLRNPCI